MPYEGGLAGPVLADDRDGLPLPDGEVDARECGDAGPVDEGDVPELYEGQRPFSSSAISSGVSGTLGSFTPSPARAV